MKAALLPDRGIVKVAGDDSRGFLNGLLTCDIGLLTPDNAGFAALLTPQGKIIMDMIVAEAPARDGGGFFLDVPRALAKSCVDRLNFYKLRAKVIVEELSEVLAVMALWEGEAATEYGLCYRDPRLPALGHRVILPPHLAAEAAADLGAAFPHEADMDQLNGVDFHKGCFVGQEVVSRMEHRGNVRTRIVPVAYEGFAPDAGAAVTAAEKQVGTFGSSAGGRALVMLRLDRAEDALAASHVLTVGAVTLRLVKLDWLRFALPGEQ